MTKKVLIAIAMVLLVCTLMSCQILESVLGLEGLAGFDSTSEQNLRMGFDQIDWLEGDDLMNQIIEICQNGRFGVEYSDRLRCIEFTSVTSPIRVRIFNDHLELRHVWGYSWTERDGWYNPKALVFECYGEKITENIPSSDIIVTNESYYNDYLKKTLYTRFETIDHILSSDASEFIYKNWTNSELYIGVIGRLSNVHVLRNIDVANLYRLLYDTLFPYTSLAVASDDEIAEILGSLGTISSYDAEAIVFNLSQNEDLTAAKVDILANLVYSKVR